MNEEEEEESKRIVAEIVKKRTGRSETEKRIREEVAKGLLPSVFSPFENARERLNDIEAAIKNEEGTVFETEKDKGDFVHGKLQVFYNYVADNYLELKKEDLDALVEDLRQLFPEMEGENKSTARSTNWKKAELTEDEFNEHKSFFDDLQNTTTSQQEREVNILYELIRSPYANGLFIDVTRQQQRIWLYKCHIYRGIIEEYATKWKGRVQPKQGDAERVKEARRIKEEQAARRDQAEKEERRAALKAEEDKKKEEEQRENDKLRRKKREREAKAKARLQRRQKALPKTPSPPPPELELPPDLVSIAVAAADITKNLCIKIDELSHSLDVTRTELGSFSFGEDKVMTDVNQTYSAMLPTLERIFALTDTIKQNERHIQEGIMDYTRNRSKLDEQFDTNRVLLKAFENGYNFFAKFQYVLDSQGFRSLERQDCNCEGRLSDKEELDFGSKDLKDDVEVLTKQVLPMVVCCDNQSSFISLIEKWLDMKTVKKVAVGTCPRHYTEIVKHPFLNHQGECLRVGPFRYIILGKDFFKPQI